MDDNNKEIIRLGRNVEKDSMEIDNALKKIPGFTKGSPVGFFDSGAGGVSVLKETVRLLPHEDFIYFADTANAPYGPKELDIIKEHSFHIMDYLVERGVKAVVVACNTATSAAIDSLRERYKDLLIVGTEPALKPAVTGTPEGTILVMATERTLKERKFSELMAKVGGEREVIKLPCPGLMELIDEGRKDSEEVMDYLRGRLEGIDMENVRAVVLGCTHYPFIAHRLKEIAPHVTFYDGASGVARYLEKNLAERNLLRDKDHAGTVEFLNSLDSPSFNERAERLFRE